MKLAAESVEFPPIRSFTRQGRWNRAANRRKIRTDRSFKVMEVNVHETAITIQQLEEDRRKHVTDMLLRKCNF